MSDLNAHCNVKYKINANRFLVTSPRSVRVVTKVVSSVTQLLYNVVEEATLNTRSLQL